MKAVLRRIKRILWEIKRFIGFFYRTAQELYKSGWKRRNARYTHFYRHTKIDDNLVLYEAFLGRGMLCGPYALFNEMMKNPEYSHMQHVWVLDDPKYHKNLIQRYSPYKNVRFVRYMSRQYLKELCRAKYLINNTTFASFFTKREQQIYINTWHGIPLKKLGFDMTNGASATSNVIRNFLQVDYLISANSFLTEIYKNAYKLDGIFEGAIIEEGYPRLDTLIHSSREEVVSRLTIAGVHIENGKKLILYAPTWKETAKDPIQVLDEYREIKRCIEKETPQYQVLIKAHQFVYELIRDCSDVDYIIPATIDANEVLPLADILISDYSSIFFDFLIFERPILFYIPDLEAYQEYRGLYVTVDQLPGPYSKNLDDVIGWIKNIEQVAQNYLQAVKDAKEWSCCSNAGKIAERILDITIHQNEDGCRLIRGLGSQKQKILLHRGRMRVNGISTSFLNLLKLIDQDKFDVSVVVTDSKDINERNLIDSIDPSIRVLMRKSTFNYTFLSSIRNRMVNAYGLGSVMQKIWPRNLYAAEARRCFGNAVFDAAIDFEGYNLTYALIIAAIPQATHAIWQHSDLQAEYRLRFPYLKTIFSCYPLFDRIVSCSQAIMEVNRNNLATEATRGKFTFAKNSIDYDRILSLSGQGELTQINGAKHLILPTGESGLGTKVKLIALEPQTVGKASGASIIDCSNSRGVIKSAVLVPDSDDGGRRCYRFVAVGRMSPEKNYINLIKGFHRFTEQGNSAILYILGEGPQRKEIEKQIRSLNMGMRVILTGNLSNPYAIMKQCDCFVLPSLHEGQPMVIHEARILNMPVIMTKFSSAEGSMIPGGQYIIEPTVQGICDGLTAFAEGLVPKNYMFNGEQYNQEAYLEFLEAIFKDEVSQARQTLYAI